MKRHLKEMIKKEAVSKLRRFFFMLFILFFIGNFVYLYIDLQMIKYEIQTLQPTTNDTLTLFL